MSKEKEKQIERLFPEAEEHEKEYLLPFFEGREVNPKDKDFITLEDYRRYEAIAGEIAMGENQLSSCEWQSIKPYVKDTFLKQQQEINRLRNQVRDLEICQGDLFQGKRLSVFPGEKEKEVIKTLVKCAKQFDLYFRGAANKGEAKPAMVNQKFKRLCADTIYSVTGWTLEHFESIIERWK